MTSAGVKKIPLIAAVLLLILCAVCLLFYRHTASVLDSQSAAERWQGENETDFAQISCFMPAGEKLTVDKIYSLRNDMYKKLKDASFDVEKESGLYNDAWSTTGKATVSSERKSGEVRVIAVGGDFFGFHPLRLLSGNYLRADDLMKDRVLLDEDTAWLLFGGTELAGMSFSVNGQPFVVAGVYEREQDRFTDLSDAGGMCVYMSFDAYSALDDNAGISCYELVMAEPVKGFVYNSISERPLIAGTEVVDNSQRFGFGRMLKLARNGASRSMQLGSAVYPYWENAARAAEDRCAALAAWVCITALYPAILAVVTVIKLLIVGKNKLEEDVIPVAKENVTEAVRVRARRRWERKHPNMR